MSSKAKSCKVGRFFSPLSAIAVVAITMLSFTIPIQKKEISYSVNSKTSTAKWLGKKTTGQHEGGISISKGKIITDGKNITGGSIAFDMNSVTNTDITDKKWSDKLITHLKSEDFFNVALYPTSTFEITEALKEGNDYDVTGKLTIRGITKEISFPAIIKMNEKTIEVTAKIIVNRIKYDMKYGSADFSDKPGDKSISNNFELSVNVVAGVDAK